MGPTPQAPGDLSGSGNWRGYATLDWTNTSTATAYYVYVSDNGSAFTRLPYPLTNGPWTAEYLIPGHTYRYQLQAYNGLQAGNYSNVASITIPRPPTPTGMSANQHGPYKASLRWNPVSGADGYYIYMGRSAPGDYSGPTSWERLPYPVTKNQFTIEYLLYPAVYWFSVSAVKYNVEGSRSAADHMSPLMENPHYWDARVAYLQNRSGDPWSSAHMQAVGGGSDSDMFLARAPILHNDWFSRIIGDHRGVSSALWATSRVSFVWEPRSGRVGAIADPSCPATSLACKDALNFQQTITTIPLGHECGSIATICPQSYSYNKMGVAGSSRYLYTGFQFANSYNTIAGFGIPGAIDGTMGVYQNGRNFRVTLTADKYPTWEFLRIPHYTVNADPQIYLFGVRQQRTIEYLCTSCHGQATNAYEG